MSWKIHLNGFKNYLRLEKGLSSNSVEAYCQDVLKLRQFLETENIQFPPESITAKELKDFMKWLHEMGIGANSQARILSGLKSFFNYLLLEDEMKVNPAKRVDPPKLGKKLPEVLALQEIDALIDSVDLSKKEGQRNRAILETLYSCGLRVSELITLRISNMYFDDGVIKVVGKGNKERWVPISNKAQHEIKVYMENDRCHLNIDPDYVDYVFLNRRGKGLTRVMIFTIIKELVIKSGIHKNVSPHTFRHSFATHLVDGGADLRVVQEMLGHESIVTTEIYTHLSNDYIRSVINEFHPRSK